MLEKLEKRLENEGFDYEVSSDVGSHHTGESHTVTVGDSYRTILIDITDGSDSYYLQTYNPHKDTFHYTKERKTVSAVINYIDRRLS